MLYVDVTNTSKARAINAAVADFITNIHNVYINEYIDIYDIYYPTSNTIEVVCVMPLKTFLYDIRMDENVDIEMDKMCKLLSNILKCNITYKYSCYNKEGYALNFLLEKNIFEGGK